MITGNKLNELLGKLMFISFFTSTNLIFLPMQYTGCSAYPRRIHDYPIVFIGLCVIELLGIKGLVLTALLILFI